MMLVQILLSVVLMVGAQANLVYNERINEIVNSSDVHLEYVFLNEDNPCARTCVHNAAPMVCRYHFKVEWYHTLSKSCFNCPFNTTDCYRKDCLPGDGHKRPVVAVNRKIPGPAVEVCKGDIIIVDVTNKLVAEGTTIHWHGQHHKDTPYMDGVPYVTQCPILPHTTFRYTFTAMQAGTHFWHSHLGMQRADGAYGALIVKVPEEEDPHSQFYDYDLAEHVIIIIDWEGVSGMDIFLAHHHNDADNKPATILINGYGRYKEFKTENNKTVYTPLERFKVEQGYRYRFRIINAGFLNCPVEVSVDNHTLKVISTDGFDIAPIDATSLVTYAGERFDFILNADQPKDLYWMRFKGLMDCDERFTRANQVAVLEYNGLNVTRDDYPDGEPNYENSHNEGMQINALNRGTESNASFVSIPQLESLDKWDSSLKVKPDFQYYIAYDFYKIDNSNFHKYPEYGFFNITNTKQRVLTPQFNHISMKNSPFALLPQRDEIKSDMFCNAENIDRNASCDGNYCECTHAIQVPLNAVVELVVIDEGFAYDANHPMHLHGYGFRVVAMERLGRNVTVEEVKKRDQEGLIKRNLLDAPYKDTVTVPDGGYTVLRFVASNPGYWIFHCHIEFHAEIGMALVVKVGEDDQMLPVPKKFPKCGDYMPEALHDIPVNACVGDGCKNACGNNTLGKIERFFGYDCHTSRGSTNGIAHILLIFLTSVTLLR